MRKESELSNPNHKLIIYFCELVTAAYCITEKWEVPLMDSQVEL